MKASPVLKKRMAEACRRLNPSFRGEWRVDGGERIYLAHLQSRGQKLEISMRESACADVERLVLDQVLRELQNGEHPP